MLIVLRQANIDVSAHYKNALTKRQAAFIRVESVEAFDYGLEFLPTKDRIRNHQLIEKVKNADWAEPNTGIIYDFLNIVPDSWLSFIPSHLEIQIPRSRQTSLDSK